MAASFPGVGCADLFLTAFVSGLGVSDLVGVIGMAALWDESISCSVFCGVALVGMENLGRFFRTFFMGGSA